MSHIALQRVIVRMMFDPEFCKQIFQNSARTLDGVDVSDNEREWLTQPDARAYGTDPHFAARTLLGLLGEYPVSGAIGVRTGAPLQRFFSSNRLHGSVQNGTSLALAFGAWLQNEPRIKDARVRESARIEHAMAELRRGHGQPVGTEISLGASVNLTHTAAGALGLFQQVGSALGTQSINAAERAINPRHPLTIGALEAGPKQCLLLEKHPDGNIALEVLSDALAALLKKARAGCTYTEMLAEARNQGADPGEDNEIVDDLIGQSLLSRS